MRLDRGAAPVGSSPFAVRAEASGSPELRILGGIDTPRRPADSGVMIRLLRDMPVGVLGLEAVDDVEKEDYENVIVPAINAAIAEHGKVRLVYVLGPEFDDYEGEAVWEDLKLGGRHPASFERVAVVTNARWAAPAIKILSVLLPGQARAFPLAELESAKRWAAEQAS